MDRARFEADGASVSGGGSGLLPQRGIRHPAGTMPVIRSPGEDTAAIIDCQLFTLPPDPPFARGGNNVEILPHGAETKHDEPRRNSELRRP
jgi:hypothetical protein